MKIFWKDNLTLQTAIKIDQPKDYVGFGNSTNDNSFVKSRLGATNYPPRKLKQGGFVDGYTGAGRQSPNNYHRTAVRRIKFRRGQT